MMKYVALAALFGVTALISSVPSHAKDFHVRRILPKITKVSCIGWQSRIYRGARAGRNCG